MNQLMSTKWNGKVFSMEKNVSILRQCVEDLMDCAEHLTTTVLGEEQRVQYLNDSIDSATIGLIQHNVGDMRTNFENMGSRPVYKGSQ